MWIRGSSDDDNSEGLHIGGATEERLGRFLPRNSHILLRISAEAILLRQRDMDTVGEKKKIRF